MGFKFPFAGEGVAREARRGGGMKELLKELESAKTPQDLDNIKSKWLGKKSALRAQMDGLRGLPAESRAARGAEINKLRAAYEAAIEDAKKNQRSEIINQKLQNDDFDMSLPGCGITPGALNPVSALENKINDAMRRLGFVVETGPEIEEPLYNFDLLDIPEHHPARDMQDTFWIEKGKKLLRTHTTSVQSRFMMGLKGDVSKLPIRIVSPGRVYRNEAVDLWHAAMFHQYEGLMVGTHVLFSELKWTIEFILKETFGPDIKIRHKPKYYPYTTMSIGSDVFCNGRWITIVGAGMVSPQVMRNFGFDPGKCGGFAFGFGLARLASMFSGMDMREFSRMDLRVFKNANGAE
jgi:phenylalanyl-tRNA synthetase alpha chain